MNNTFYINVVNEKYVAIKYNVGVEKKASFFFQ